MNGVMINQWTQVQSKRLHPTVLADGNLAGAALLDSDQKWPVCDCIPDNPDVDLNDPDEISRVSYDTSKFFAHHVSKLVQLADRTQKYVFMDCWGAAFYIDPKVRAVRTLVQPDKLKTFGMLPLENGIMQYKTVRRLPAEVKEKGYRYSYEHFIWRMILAASRGRLPSGVDLDRRYRLRHRLDFLQLQYFPHADQIAVAWHETESSIREICHALPLPQSPIFAFFTTASSMGYLCPADSSSASFAATENNPFAENRVFPNLRKIFFLPTSNSRQ